MSKNRPKVETHEMEQRVATLRLAGMGFEQIAREVGYADASGAYRAYRRVLERQITPVAEEIREEEIARLDRLIMAHWPYALGARGAEPSGKHADTVLKAMDRKARMLGLDAPIKQAVEITNYDDGDAVRAMVAALARTLADQA